MYYTDLASKIAELIKAEIGKGIKAEEICVIAPQWFMLFDLSGKLRLLLPDVPFGAPDISPIKYDPMNPLFLIAKLLFMPAGKNVRLRKRIATEFISIIRDDFRIMLSDDIQSYDVLSAVNCCRHIDADGIICLSVAIQKVFALLNICVSKESSLSELKASFFDEICSRVKRYSLAIDFESISKYFGDKNAVVISTLHGVKGEEYTTVIAAGLFIVTGQSPSLLGMDEMLQEWKGADQFIIVKDTWFKKVQMRKILLLFTFFKRYLLENGVGSDHIVEIALDGIENEELIDPKMLFDFQGKPLRH